MDEAMKSAPTRFHRAVFPRRRAVIGTIAAVVAFGFIVFVAFRLAPELSSASFAFLYDKAGWDIPFSFLPYSSGDPYWWVFLVGLGNTIGTGAIAICTATLVGFGIGLARLSRNQLLADLGRAYVDVVRNIPLILQASFWYAVVLHLPPIREAYAFWNSVYLSNRGLFLPKFNEMAVVLAAVLLFGLAIWLAARWRRMRRNDDDEPLAPSHGRRDALVAAAAAAGGCLIVALHPGAFGVEWPVRAGLNFRGGFRLPPEFVALLVAITIYRGAFIAEVFRGGLQSVAQGQIDAARSLGLRPWMVLLKIRLPLALVSIVPALSSEFIIIMKVTSIGIVVGFWDLFAVSSNSSMMTGRTLEVLFVMVAIYIGLNYAIVALMNVVNDRMRLPGNGK
jgi:His/Glu/Gln/Arg/opine family amino acid ABC transporter permease subunit